MPNEVIQAAPISGSSSSSAKRRPKLKPRAGATGRKDAYFFRPEDLTVVGVDTKDGEEHPLYDERAFEPLDEAMVRNIMHYGVKVAIVIRKNGPNSEVVDGRRRVLHAREANRRLAERGEPPVKVLATGDKYSRDANLMGVMLSANEHRKDDTPLNRARKAARMMARGADDDEVKVTFGISDSTLRVWKNLLDLDGRVQARVDQGEIGAIAAAKLADLPRDQQVERCEAMIAEGMTTAAQAGAVVKGAKNGKKVTRDDVVKPPSKAVLKKLVKALESDEDHGVEVSDEFVRGIKFALGELKPSAIKNMLVALRRAGFKG